MSARNAAQTNGSTRHLDHSDMAALTAPGAGERSALAEPLNDVELQHTIDRLAGNIADVLAERDALRSEVAALQVELAIAEARLAENSRNADIVAKITGLVQEMGASTPAPIETRPADEAPGESTLAPAVGAIGAQPASLSFLELQDLLSAGASAGASTADPDPIQPEAPAPVAAAKVERTAGPTMAPAASPKKRTAGAWPARVLAWASVGAVAVAVAAVLAITAGPRVLPYQTFYVFGRSMEPTIPLGSMVVLSPVSFDQIEVGDVITVERPDAPGALVTHRVIGIEDTPQGPGLVTQGDANATPDPWRVQAAGEGYRLLFSIPYLGYLLYTFQSPIGRFGLVIVPAIALAGLLLMQLWRPRRALEAAMAAS